MNNNNFLNDIKENAYPLLIEKFETDEQFVKDGDDYKLAGDFYKNQTRIALRNFGLIDPESLDEYIARDGYFALEKCLFHLSPKEIIDIMIDANLKGRGGAGFPAGIKWKTAYDEDVEQKYVICNADEGDPGAFMDRSILEGDPHVVLEAMAICGYAIGANQGYIYVRAEYPTAVKRLQFAIEQANKAGVLGENILGSDFSFNIELRLGSGAFVCGESTALTASIEGKRGMPQAKVYRTTVRGLFDKPTVVNNVETLANVPRIILKGSDWFKSIGTEDSPGTKVFALVGKIKNAGLVEVPMGITIKEILYDIGEGTGTEHEILSIQTGGPSGGCIPPQLFDTKIDFRSLKEIGSIMGSGGMVVMDDSDCMVDIAKFFLEFTVDESCGKCPPCREGTKRMLEVLQKIIKGDGTEDDLNTLKELSDYITNYSLCGLGQTAANPVASTLHYFYDEYVKHIEEKKCPAGKCKDLTQYYIGDNCVGCGACKRMCPVGCISGERREIHHINQAECIKCGNCHEVCPTKPKSVIIH